MQTIDRTPLTTLQRLAVFLLVLLLLQALFPPRPARAATWLVTKIADTNDGVCDTDCSLREAIAVSANSDTIRFAVSLLDQTITLTAGALVIDKDLAITGPGATRLAISGNNASRVFTITANRTVSISGLTIKDGRVLVPRLDIGGGGIYNNGILTLNGVLVTANVVVDDGGGGLGGGIMNDIDAQLTIINSTISQNRIEDTGRGGCFGGGISSSGPLSLFNVTISNNQAVEQGNYCWGVGIDHADAPLTLNFVTIANNTASSTAPVGDRVQGGGLSMVAGILNVSNTIFAGNIPNNCELFVETTSGGYNLDYNANQAGTCNLEAGSQSTDTVGVNPLLTPLQDNGGSVPTHGLQLNSPAVDRIPNGTNGCLAGQTTDARGAVRAGGENRGGPACDSGAFEAASIQQPAALTLVDVQAVGAPSLAPWLVAASVVAALGLTLILARRQFFRS
jgi:CSLREA domain-containing protein